MFFIFHSSSSSITIESNDSFRCSFREFFESSHSKFDANFKCIFIVNDNFSRYTCSILIRILKSSSILSFSFFDDREIIMFLEFRTSYHLSCRSFSFDACQSVSSLWLWLLSRLVWSMLVIISCVRIYFLLCLLRF